MPGPSIGESASCILRYAVFGQHRCCPASGLDALDIALDALAAEAAILDAVAAIPPEQHCMLREQSVFDRFYIDVLTNVVTVVETLTNDTFNAGLASPTVIIMAKGNISPRLDDTAAMALS